jgi:hypothetical protein
MRRGCRWNKAFRCNSDTSKVENHSGRSNFFRGLKIGCGIWIRPWVGPANACMHGCDTQANGLDLSRCDLNGTTHHIGLFLFGQGLGTPPCRTPSPPTTLLLPSASGRRTPAKDQANTGFALVFCSILSACVRVRPGLLIGDGRGDASGDGNAATGEGVEHWDC